MIDMLESVRSDALALLTISKSQKTRYHNELAKLTVENKALEQKVKKLQREVGDENKSDKQNVERGTKTSPRIEDEAIQRELREKDNIIEELNMKLKVKTDVNESFLQTIKDLRHEV